MFCWKWDTGKAKWCECDERNFANHNNFFFFESECNSLFFFFGVVLWLCVVGTDCVIARQGQFVQGLGHNHHR